MVIRNIIGIITQIASVLLYSQDQHRKCSMNFVDKNLFVIVVYMTACPAITGAILISFPIGQSGKDLTYDDILKCSGYELSKTFTNKMFRTCRKHLNKLNKLIS